MSDTDEKRRQAGPPAGLGDGELRITLWRDVWVEFTGTAAALQAEGLIPEGLDWPPMTTGQRWEAGRLAFWLRRTRPEGHRGPRRTWAVLDHWSVKVQVIGRGLLRPPRDFLAPGAEGSRGCTRGAPPAPTPGAEDVRRRARAALADAAFQRFRARLPGLPPPRRGRKLRTAGGGAEGGRP